jgi:hypothetical protein
MVNDALPESIKAFLDNPVRKSLNCRACGAILVYVQTFWFMCRLTSGYSEAGKSGRSPCHFVLTARCTAR